jgi:hypothetical protein
LKSAENAATNTIPGDKHSYLSNECIFGTVGCPRHINLRLAHASRFGLSGWFRLNSIAVLALFLAQTMTSASILRFRAKLRKGRLEHGYELASSTATRPFVKLFYSQKIQVQQPRMMSIATGEATDNIEWEQQDTMLIVHMTIEIRDVSS